MPYLTAEALSLLSDIAARGSLVRWTLAPLWTRDTCEGAYLSEDEPVDPDDVDALIEAGLLERTATERAGEETFTTYAVSAAGRTALGARRMERAA